MCNFRRVNFFPVFAYVIAVCQALSRNQVYQSNNNFDNPENWRDGRVPCSGNKIEFNPESMISIFVQTNLTITEIFLPLNGELIFDEGVIWGTSDELSSCSDNSGYVSTFKSEVDNWFDPSNWQSAVEDTIQSPLDLLDIESVPCDFDKIQFPIKNSWSVEIPFDLKAAGLKIWNQEYDVENFVNYRNTTSGQYQFPGEGSVLSVNEVCFDPTGCLCRNPRNMQIEKAICDFVACPPDQCDNPLHPIGQCCSTCGGLITMMYSETSYVEDRMLQELHQLKTNGNYSNVHFTLSKITYDSTEISDFTINNRIQIVVRDEGINSDNGHNAKLFADELVNLIHSDSSLGVTNVTSEFSGEGRSPAHGLSGGVVTAVVLGVIVAVLLLIITAVYVSRRYRSDGLSFPYKLKSDKGISNLMFDMDVSKSIEEPISSVEKKSASITGLPEPNVTISDFGISFGNPVYHEEDV